MIQVWDPFVRVFHWSLALSFAVAWLSGESWEALHVWAGYAAAALVLFRIGWGFAGEGYARFVQFVRPPRVVFAYLADIAARREARYVGHNPAGGAMIVALIATLLATALTGWLLTTDAYWGDDGAKAVHNGVAHLLLLLVLGHLAGVALASLRHHENLVRAMVVGRKRAPAPGDVA